MRLHHIGRLCWDKIPTSDMALKQRHKTDEIVTNDMKMGWNFDSKIQQTLLKFRNYRQKYNDIKTIESLHQFWPHFPFKGKGPGHSPMQGWHLPPVTEVCLVFIIKQWSPLTWYRVISKNSLCYFFPFGTIFLLVLKFWFMSTICWHTHPIFIVSLGSNHRRFSCYILSRR